MKSSPYISICIPTYEMKGLGVKYLEHSFEILKKQSFNNFEVIISDHSKNDAIKNLCNKYKDYINIKYYRNKKNIGSSSSNINNALKNASGKIIKILFQDDFLYNDKSLEEIVNNFNIKEDNWMVTACEHSYDGKTFFRKFYPKYNKMIFLGKNTISSPSVLTIKNNTKIFFDEKLIWLMDCDYYKRCYDNFGQPKILNKINVVNRVGDHQVSNSLVNKMTKIKETVYIIIKNIKIKQNIEIEKATLVAVSSIKIKETIKALKKSMHGIKYKEVLLISDEKPENLPNNIKYKKCKRINSLDEYSFFMLYELHKYIKTEYAIIVQYDGYVINPKKWKNIFLEYDYIGALWPKNMFFTSEGKNIRVGNGGFSLRSKKVLSFFHKLKIPFDNKGNKYLNEDGMICNYYRKKLENSGVKFANKKIASMWSRELFCDDYYRSDSFGFHRYKNYKLQILKNLIKKI